MATSTIPYDMPLKYVSFNLNQSIITQYSQTWATSARGRVYLSPGIEFDYMHKIVAVSNGNWSSTNDNVVIIPYARNDNTVSWYIAKGTASDLGDAFAQVVNILYY